MPLAVLVILVVVLSILSYFFLRPLQVLSKKEFLISHSLIAIGLLLLLGWLWLNKDQFAEVTMLMGGIWTLFGGLCFATTYILRRMNYHK
jgi:hypothetical protein